MNSPSDIPLAWSRSLTGAVICAHLLPLACLPGQGVPVWVRISVLLAVVVSGVAAARARRRVRNAVLRPFAESANVVCGTQVLQGRLLPSSLEAGPMVILHWRGEDDGRLRHYVLTHDAFPVEAWRQIKVWLRWTIQKSA